MTFLNPYIVGLYHKPIEETSNHFFDIMMFLPYSQSPYSKTFKYVFKVHSLFASLYVTQLSMYFHQWNHFLIQKIYEWIDVASGFSVLYLWEAYFCIILHKIQLSQAHFPFHIWITAMALGFAFLLYYFHKYHTITWEYFSIISKELCAICLFPI